MKRGTLVAATGRDLLSMFHAAARWLGRYSARVDSINVFPVADGDTGTNMLRTLEAALAAAGGSRSDTGAPGSDGGSPTAAAVSSALSRGALEGARGNSGVILSQFFRGMAATLEGKETCAGEDLARWFGLADDFARGGIADAVEGTILTALTDSTRALREALAGSPCPFSAALGIAVRATRESVARTPSLLPVLKESGVVDAGAEGFLRILEGAERASLAVDDPTLGAVPPPLERAAAGSPSLLSGAAGSGTFCTGFLVEGSELPLSQIRARLASEGTSLIVAGDPRALRIHIHTAHPETVIAYARSLGTVSRVDRHELPTRRAPRPPRLAIAAVAPGEGIADVIEGLGATPLVSPSGSGVPGMEEIRDALRSLPGEQVILLPNGRDAVTAAREAVLFAPRPVTIIPTLTVPQGIAALVAFRFDSDFTENAALMERAAQSVRTIEVTWAECGADALPEGGAQGWLDCLPIGSWDDPVHAVEELLGRIDTAGAETVTVYYGASVSPSLVERVCRTIDRVMAHAETQTLSGGQARPCLIISVE